MDNQQNFDLRSGILTRTDQAFHQATVDLSLFLRVPAGEPVLPTAARLLEFPELLPVDASQFDLALSTAFERSPELRRQRHQQERLLVERRLAENLTLPAMNAYLAGSQDIGHSKLNTRRGSKPTPAWSWHDGSRPPSASNSASGARTSSLAERNAKADYFRALTDHRAALGVDAKGSEASPVQGDLNHDQRK